jgi:lipid II:glycine glycyltransferase (peptidoglycan interpeptide bridge formation enzyme)
MSHSSMQNTWKVWSGADQDWNQIASRLDNFNLYQSAEWSAHKRNSGWQHCRIFVSDSVSVIQCAAQCLYRKGPLNSVVVWIPGGPIGNLNFVDANLVDTLKNHFHSRLVYVRSSMMCASTPAITNQLTTNGWSLASMTIGATASLVYALDADENERLDRCSSNWRRNLKRSGRNPQPAYIWDSPKAQEISEAYSYMDDFKKVKGVSLLRSIGEIQSVIDTFGDQLLCVRIDDTDGSPLAIRAAICIENNAWDFIAITTPAGRKTYASHAVFWLMANTCGQRGMKQIDLSGIDIKNNRGVYDFKKGTGAKQLDFQGEWEISRPKLLRPFASRLIAQRVK